MLVAPAGYFAPDQPAVSRIQHTGFITIWDRKACRVKAPGASTNMGYGMMCLAIMRIGC